MIFKPELAHLVVQGKKTATRRIIVAGKPCHYQVGNDYAVQPGRGKHQIGRITLIDIERQELGALSYNDARAEGFRTRADFARYWMRLHERDYSPNGATADELLELWLQRHGETPVWVITFERKRTFDVVLDTRPVFLHRNLGLTTDPSRKAAGEPEVLGVDLGTASLARARRQAELEHKARLKRVHELVDRARTVLAEAVSAEVDVAPDIAVFEQRVHELELRLKAA